MKFFNSLISGDVLDAYPQRVRAAGTVFIEGIDPGAVLVIGETKPPAIEFGAEMPCRVKVVSDVDDDPGSLAQIGTLFHTRETDSWRRRVLHQLEITEIAKTGRCPAIFPFGPPDLPVGAIGSDHDNARCIRPVVPERGIRDRRHRTQSHEHRLQERYPGHADGIDI